MYGVRAVSSSNVLRSTFNEQRQSLELHRWTLLTPAYQRPSQIMTTLTACFWALQCISFMARSQVLHSVLRSSPKTRHSIFSLSTLDTAVSIPYSVLMIGSNRMALCTLHCFGQPPAGTATAVWPAQNPVQGPETRGRQGLADPRSTCY